LTPASFHHRNKQETSVLDDEQKQRNVHDKPQSQLVNEENVSRNNNNNQPWTPQSHKPSRMQWQQ
jgi:hypothetical protein